MAKTIQIGFALAVAGQSVVASAFNSTGKTVAEFQKRLSQASRTAGQIENYQKLQTRLSENSAKMAALGASAGNTHGASTRLQSAIERDTRALSELREQLTGAGVDMNNLSGAQRKYAQDAERYSAAHTRYKDAQARYSAAKQGLSWNALKGEVITSAGLGLALAVPTKTAAGFEQAMARVSAVSGATGEDFEQLSAQARQLGRDTRYTATQAAQSQENLARAGFKTNEIISAMPGLLDMASAEGMGLAEAADIAASTMRGFNLSADQSGRVADVLAAASAGSNTNITELGEAMKFVAPIASGLNVSLEETTAMLGAMANAGVKGSQSGTALRGAFTRLAREPAMAEKALKQLGIASRDAQGHMRKLPDLMAAMQKKMRGWGEADQTKVLTEIFGQEAASGMLAVMNATQSGALADFEASLRASGGSASRMAKVMNATAQGAMTRLSSAWESVQISVGTVLLPAVADVADWLAKLLSNVSQLAEKYPQFTEYIVKASASVAGLVIAFSGISIVSRFFTLMTSGVGVMRAFFGLVATQRGVGAATGGVAAVSAAAAPAMRTGALASGMGHAAVIGAVGVPAAMMLAEHYQKGQEEKADAAFNEEASLAELSRAQSRLFEALEQRAKTGFEKLNTGGLDEGQNRILQQVVERRKGQFADNLMPIVNTLNEQKRLNVKREDVMQWGAQLVQAMNGSREAIQALPEALRFLAQSSEAIAVMRDAGTGTGTAPSVVVNAAPHAMGGIFSAPHVGLVAEAGPEAVIPLSDRSRGLPLWMAAGSEMGLRFGGGTTNNITRGGATINITVNGGGGDDVGLVERIRMAVEDALRANQDYESRTALA